MPFDAPHIHLMVNHFPIILTMAGTVAAVIALATRRRVVWLYAVATLTIAALTVYPVHLTGDLAAHVMKHKWYVVKDAVEAHDDFSGITMWVMLVTGALSAFAWWRLVRQGGDEPAPGWLRLLIVVGALAGTGTGAYTAYLGGEIVYGSPRLLTAPTASPAGSVGATQPSAGAVGP
jgi:uncharacterized membrane protein